MTNTTTKSDFTLAEAEECFAEMTEANRKLFLCFLRLLKEEKCDQQLSEMASLIENPESDPTALWNFIAKIVEAEAARKAHLGHLN